MTLPRAVRVRPIPLLLIFYGVASLLHFSHNAEFLADYPNLPVWLSRVWVYVAWSCITTVGVVGWLLTRAGRQAAGLILIAGYAALGFDGLLHYRQAPFASHTTAMNVTILLDVCAAALLLIAVAVVAARRLRRIA